MSLELTAALVCDGCGCRVTTEPEHRSTQSLVPYFEVKILAQRIGWISASRGRYLPKAHYCSACCDKPFKPIPKKNRTALKIIRSDILANDF